MLELEKKWSTFASEYLVYDETDNVIKLFFTGKDDSPKKYNDGKWRYILGRNVFYGTPVEISKIRDDAVPHLGDCEPTLVTTKLFPILELDENEKRGLYVVRNENGQLRLFSERPVKNSRNGEWTIHTFLNPKLCVGQEINEDEISQDINPQWEDTEPIRVKSFYCKIS